MEITKKLEIGYPKPIKTTEVFSKLLVNLSVLPSNGFPIIIKNNSKTKDNQEEMSNF